jgi:hypothetical protein
MEHSELFGILRSLGIVKCTESLDASDSEPGRVTTKKTAWAAKSMDHSRTKVLRCCNRRAVARDLGM